MLRRPSTRRRVADALDVIAFELLKANNQREEMDRKVQAQAIADRALQVRLNHEALQATERLHRADFAEISAEHDRLALQRERQDDEQ